MDSFWQDKRVIVTGGAGFLGSFLTEKLHQFDAGEIFVPLQDKYGLVKLEDIQRMYADAMKTGSSSLKTIVIHLAALAGGIGANRVRPAEFFYINLMMGVQLRHEAWQRNVDKFVAIASSRDTQNPFGMALDHVSSTRGWSAAISANEAAWEQEWQRTDVIIDGDGTD